MPNSRGSMVFKTVVTAMTILAGSSAILRGADAASVVGPETNSCGVNSLYAAATCLGVDVSWSDVRSRTRWESGKLLPAENLKAAVESFQDLAVEAKQASIADLDSHLSNGVAILLVRLDSPEINHSMCVVDKLSEGYLFIDDSLRTRMIPETALRRIWNGEALLISRSDTVSGRDVFIALLFPVSMIIYLAYDIIAEGHRGRQKSIG